MPPLSRHRQLIAAPIVPLLHQVMLASLAVHIRSLARSLWYRSGPPMGIEASVNELAGSVAQSHFVQHERIHLTPRLSEAS